MKRIFRSGLPGDAFDTSRGSRYMEDTSGETRCRISSSISFRVYSNIYARREKDLPEGDQITIVNLVSWIVSTTMWDEVNNSKAPSWM